MERGKAFLVVGHKQWGKSFTLKALTDGSTSVRYMSIGDQRIFIRRMSNDDRHEEFRDFVRSLSPTDKQNVIMAFCPVFDDDADETLRDLQRHYEIFSFVILHAHDPRRNRRIRKEEIEALRGFGQVEVFDQYGEPADRAVALRAYIAQHVGSGQIA